MSPRLALAVTMLFGSLAAGLIAGSGVGRGDDFVAEKSDAIQVAMSSCAGGYHQDSRGNCEPDYGIVDSRCQAGYEAAPFPNGNSYHCVPVPEGY